MYKVDCIRNYTYKYVYDRKSIVNSLENKDADISASRTVVFACSMPSTDHKFREGCDDIPLEVTVPLS